MLSVQLANVLVKNDVAKVADFGYAREIGTSFSLTFRCRKQQEHSSLVLRLAGHVADPGRSEL